MTGLLILFLGTATLLWLSVFGYLLVLVSIASRRRPGERGEPALPEIAVVIPTLNEEDIIASKLADLRRTDYPRDRMTVVIVDGGSVDRTKELILQEIDRGENIQLESPDGALGLAHDLKYAIELLTQEIVVVTDADTVLEPSCIRKVVTMLLQNPDTAIVGAMLSPSNHLLEEHMHRWYLNHLWWLEGEALSSTGVSGACYALRRKTVLPMYEDARVTDINLPLASPAKGYRTRICRAAHATEVRPPQNAMEFVRFRSSRAGLYVSELLHSWKCASGPLLFRVMCAIRLLHFLLLPWVGTAFAVSACLLMVTPYWPWPIITLFAFATSMLLTLFPSNLLAGEGRRWWRLSLAAGRLLALTFISRLGFNFNPRHRVL